MMVFTFSVLNWKYHSWINLIQKKIINILQTVVDILHFYIIPEMSHQVSRRDLNPMVFLVFISFSFDILISFWVRLTYSCINCRKLLVGATLLWLNVFTVSSTSSFPAICCSSSITFWCDQIFFSHFTSTSLALLRCRVM